MLLDRGADYLADERLGQAADFRVDGDGGGERAARTPYHDLILMPLDLMSLDLGGPADGRRHLQCYLCARSFRSPARSEVVPDAT